MAEEIKDLSFSQRKKFRIDGDYNRMLELDTSDMNVLVRLQETYPKMESLARGAIAKMSDISKTSDDDDETSSLAEVAEVLKSIDTEMRGYMDYIFDSNVSEMCAVNGNMFDPHNGEFRFEHIIEVLTPLYANNLAGEFKKMQDNVKKHTTKYANGNRRKKKNV